MNINLDEWIDLHSKTPEKFETKRQEQIDTLMVQSFCDTQRLILKGIQSTIDRGLQKLQ